MFPPTPQRARRKQKPVPNITDYYSEIFGQLDVFWDEDERGRRQEQQILRVCSQRLSTQSVVLLERLYARAGEGFTRKLLARKIYKLRHDYLNSYKEHSDRSLIMLVERDNWFDRWEGVFILGYFGGDAATKYLEERMLHEPCTDLVYAMQQALSRIKRKRKERKLKRGF